MAEDDGGEESPSTTETTHTGVTGSGTGKHYKGKRGQRPGTRKSQSTSKFEGRCDGLKGHVYDNASPRAAAGMYTKTTEKVGEYIGRTYPYGSDLKKAIQQEAMPNLDNEKPAQLTADADEVDKEIWKMEIKEFAQRKIALRENIKTAYSLIYGQCSDALRVELKAHADYRVASKTSDALLLLKIIKGTMYSSYRAQKYHHQAVHMALRKLLLLKQGPGMSCQDYLRIFNAAVKDIEDKGGMIGIHPIGVEKALKQLYPTVLKTAATSTQVAEAEAQAREEYLACAFILGSDRERYGGLIRDLENKYILGHDRFPKSVTAAYYLLTHWKT